MAEYDAAALADPFFVPDKQDGYHYFWANRADRNMVEMLGQGWEIVSGAPELPPAVRQKLTGLTGQNSEVPITDEIRTRGDLVLVRMKDELFETRVAAPDRAKIARQQSSLDVLVQQANDQARSALLKSRQRTVRDRHVFQTSDDPEFKDQGVQKP